MKLIKKQISGLTYFSIDNLSISLDVSKRYDLNLWSEGTRKQGNYAKTLYFDDTLEEWRTRDCECSNKDKSLDFSIVIENNVLTSLETLKIYGIDNGGVHIFNEVYFELNEIGGVEPQIKIYSHSIMINHKTDNKQVVFQVLSNINELYDINNISNNKMLRTTIGIPAVRVSSPTTADMIIFKSNGTQFVINGTENWDIADCVLMVDDIVDLTNTDL